MLGVNLASGFGAWRDARPSSRAEQRDGQLRIARPVNRGASDDALDLVSASLFEIGAGGRRALFDVDGAPQSISILRRERDLANAMLDGLSARFKTSDPRLLLAKRGLWMPSVEQAFADVEAISDKGAARALWAQFARPFASALSPGDRLGVGPVTCAAIDLSARSESRLPIADDVLVVVRRGRASLAPLEAPGLPELTLGQMLRLSGDPLLKKLYCAFGLRRTVGVLLQASADCVRSMAASASVSPAHLRTTFKRVCAEGLDRLDTPLFDNAPAISRRSAKARAGQPCGSVPVLMYHRIAPDGEAALDRYRTHPECFQSQLAALSDAGAQSITSRDLLRAWETGEALPERAVLITFDDGYRDFADYAAPALLRRNFCAEVFLVTDLVGARSSWDARYGAPADLMDWPEILDLQKQGMAFGSHLATHRPSTHLTTRELVDEAARSRAALSAKLGSLALSVAMPYGLYDDRTAPILESCGYRVGFATRRGVADSAQHRLMLPRIEVAGGLTLDQFRELLPWP